jgi:hypothetical protein
VGNFLIAVPRDDMFMERETAVKQILLLSNRNQSQIVNKPLTRSYSWFVDSPRTSRTVGASLPGDVTLTCGEETGLAPGSRGFPKYGAASCDVYSSTRLAFVSRNPDLAHAVSSDGTTAMHVLLNRIPARMIPSGRSDSVPQTSAPATPSSSTNCIPAQANS